MLVTSPWSSCLIDVFFFCFFLCRTAHPVMREAKVNMSCSTSLSFSTLPMTSTKQSVGFGLNLMFKILESVWKSSLEGENLNSISNYDRKTFEDVKRSLSSTTWFKKPEKSPVMDTSILLFDRSLSPPLRYSRLARSSKVISMNPEEQNHKKTSTKQGITQTLRVLLITFC